MAFRRISDVRDKPLVLTRPFERCLIDKISSKIIARDETCVWKYCQSDNSGEFNDLVDKFPNIKFIKSTPYKPWSNGIIERVHGFLKRYTYWGEELKKRNNEKLNFKKQLKKITLIYNNRKYSVTKQAPVDIHFPQYDGKNLDATHIPEIAKKKVNKRIEYFDHLKREKTAPRAFPEIKKGDYVRTLIPRDKIGKIYQNWSDEVFLVL